MSVPVPLSTLREVVAARGPDAFVTSAGATPHPHLKHVRVAIGDDGELICAAGGRVEANVATSPNVVLLWPGSGPRGHSLLVDGSARVTDTDLVVSPVRAMLHRPPWLAAGDAVPLPVAGEVPVRGWSVGEPDDDVDASALRGLADLLMASDAHGPTGVTRALVVVHRGRIVVERYGPDTDHDTAMPSWSMAKSVLHAAVGVLVRDGRIDVAAPAPIEAWHGSDDPRAAITVRDLLEMRDGLSWREDYVSGDGSDVIEMLFGSGHRNMAAHAATRPAAHEPGTVFNYSSGTSVLLADVVATVLVGSDADPAAREAAVRGFLARELFDPVGMTSARPDFDPAGTWVASSALWATARDWARFALLYLRGGSWGDRRVLAGDWVDSARRPRGYDPVSDQGYGWHWWWVPDRHGTFAAAGFEGQRIEISPALDLVVVRLGVTPTERSANLRARLAEIVESFAPEP